MKKIFRKITALLVAFVFICLCGVNAFAKTITEDYDNDRYVVTANYSISQKSTGGTIFVTDNGRMFSNPYLYVSVTYRYVKLNGVTPEVKIETKSDTQRYAYSASVTFSNSTIREMVNATYTFVADIPCSYGTQTFAPRADTITYTLPAE